MKKTTLLFIVVASFLNVISAQTVFQLELADSTMTLINQDVSYDPAYFSIDYPNGDVPSDKGVCTDVVIRAYRKLGIDLQKEVHEYMEENFDKYPKICGLSGTDKNIDHRRVPNLMVYFSRKGQVLPVTRNPKDYKPGEIVCWNLGGNVTHIGILVNKKSHNGERFLIVHNIGYGQVLDDCLFDFEIIGHYRFEK